MQLGRPCRHSSRPQPPTCRTLCRMLPQEVIGVGPDIPVVIPADHRQRFVIDAIAFYVLRDGCEFEQVRWPGLGAA